MLFIYKSVLAKCHVYSYYVHTHIHMLKSYLDLEMESCLTLQMKKNT